MSYYLNDITREPKRGDIFYIKHSKQFITNPDNCQTRPGIIVSNDYINGSTSVEVVYLTTKNVQGEATQVPVCGKVPSHALCEAICTVPKTRLDSFIRQCTPEEMHAVEIAMLVSLGISPKVEKKENEEGIYKQLYEQLLSKIIKEVKTV